MMRLALTLMLFLVLDPAYLRAQEKIAVPDETLIDVQPGERGVPESWKLAIYRPKHLPATEAGALVEGLLGESARVIVEPTGNSLLIRAAEPQLKEIQAVLDNLDQPPKQIAFEVMFADLPAATEEASNAQGDSEAAWLSRLKNLEGKTLAKTSKLRLMAIENQKAMAQFGEQTAVVSGVQQAFGGRGAPPERSPVYRNTATGTIVQCTARVSEDGTILAELEIERTRLAPESGAVLEESDDRGSLRTPGQLTTTCKTTVKLTPGKPVVLSGLKSAGTNGSTVNLIVITAERTKEK